MGLNLRLSLLRLRQKINFRGVRILLVFIYMAVTASVLVYHFHTAGEVLEEEEQGARGAGHGGQGVLPLGQGFLMVGGSQADFRKAGVQVRDLTFKDLFNLVKDKGQNGSNMTWNLLKLRIRIF